MGRFARKQCVLIMAGGTGGHVFPGLAVAQNLRARGVEVIWLGTQGGMEVALVTQAGFPVHTLPVSGLRGRGLMTWLLAPWRLSHALWAALILMHRLRPAVVLGFGGFASGPGGLMAAALGYPLMIHEQNSIAGLTNRSLARLADQVLEAFPQTFPASRQAITVGNPVREAIAALPPPEHRFQDREGPLRLLVLGGSLGALTLNQSVPAALALLAERRAYTVIHQTGQRTLAQAQQAYADAGITPQQLSPFIEDMAAAYAWADIVICRAGALTLAELAAAGLGAILVPYPHAVDDHQRHNAQYLVDAGAALCLPETQCNPETLADGLAGLDRAQALVMARQARTLAKPLATQTVADHCLRLGGLASTQGG
ncbi:undecaprenyldiphospho-muramoylpentapeptide beta-N-acetylglucosaminyltransferase [Thiorhodospira sibirica]|uniref:undecaprenyldiphospho-muramoylpentapeptide beta-N-acetylglucosaminyltransferase n=1 Tax=Thiorhodospira sibirica TaxID=154347 RepID=UPI00022C4045|nr:undecaprenyldiphospho-muramoylpentapeptide beta-N-acetylglucosaminyltransferase [Thiorhodospira sibirica]